MTSSVFSTYGLGGIDPQASCGIAPSAGGSLNRGRINKQDLLKEGMAEKSVCPIKQLQRKCRDLKANMGSKLIDVSILKNTELFTLILHIYTGKKTDTNTKLEDG